GVKSNCTLFPYTFRGEPATMCLAWDASYLADKRALIQALGARFDNHPALAHIYFTAACSSNGYEGHCRIDENQYTAAGYTPERFNQAYESILLDYMAAFPRTPITIELHAIFGRIDMWETLWDTGRSSGKLGLAAWWCGERLSLSGFDTVPVWPLIQQAAAESYAVCQTVGNFTEQPYRFTDLQLPVPLDYGVETDWDAADIERSFADTMAWVSGTAVNAGQPGLPLPFAAIEVWSQDLRNAALQERLATLLDGDPLFADNFELD
ncbi:MAG: hypothetical protein KDI37_10245, partial [Xanthomonadales bacterium]|nr:hypothetical protein [Xanthomonadales bacterium]